MLKSTRLILGFLLSIYTATSPVFGQEQDRKLTHEQIDAVIVQLLTTRNQGDKRVKDVELFDSLPIVSLFILNEKNNQSADISCYKMLVDKYKQFNLDLNSSERETVVNTIITKGRLFLNKDDIAHSINYYRSIISWLEDMRDEKIVDFNLTVKKELADFYDKNAAEYRNRNGIKDETPVTPGVTPTPISLPTVVPKPTHLPANQKTTEILPAPNSPANYGWWVFALILSALLLIWLVKGLK